MIRERLEDFNIVLTVAIGLSALIPFLPLLLARLQDTSLWTIDLTLLIVGVPATLLLWTVPTAVVAAVSTTRFRKEVLGSLVVLPVGLVAPVALPLGIGLIGGLLLVSQKTAQLYNGGLFWTFVRSTGIAITSLSLVIGLFAAGTYAASPGLQADAQEVVVNETITQSLQFVDVGQDAMTTALTEQVTAQTQQVSQATILLTAQNVSQEMQEDGSFTASQQQVLQNAFTRAQNEIPPIVSREARQQLEAQVDQHGTTVDPSTLQDQIEPLVERFAAPTPLFLIGIVLWVVSVAAILKFPFALATYPLAALLTIGIQRFGATDTAAGKASDTGEETAEDDDS